MGLLFVFFLSGLAGLVYEVVWTRMLALSFGATAYAVSAVLSSFFAGMALGSFAGGKLIDRGHRPLRVYALLEAALGTYALLFPWLFSRIEDAYLSLHLLLAPEPSAAYLIRFALAFALLVVPTALMGATFPVMSRHVVRHREGLGREIGRLYGWNTLGGVCGVFLAGFFLIRWAGLQTTLFLAAGINLSLAGAAFLMSLQPRAPGPGGPMPTRAAAPADRPKPLLLALFGLSGFTALAYEVLWTRALVNVFSSTVYTFSVMLAAFLSGLALGSLTFARPAASRRDPLFAFGLVEVLIGVAAGLCLFCFSPLSGAVAKAIYGPSPSAWLPRTGVTLLISFLVMFPAAFLLGGTLPLISQAYVGRLERLGSRIGELYGANTLGAIFGASLTGFFLLPRLGVQGSILLMAALNLALGSAALCLDPARERRPKLAALLGVGVIAGLFSLSAAGGSFSGPPEEGRERIYHHEGVGATVSVLQTRREGYRALKVNGLYTQGGTDPYALRVQRRQGHLPLLLHSRPAAVLVIGLATGITLGAVGLHPVERIDCVEIVPGIVEAAGHFSRENGDILRDPRVRIFVEDGRNYLLTTSSRYDLIIADVFQVDTGGDGESLRPGALPGVPETAGARGADGPVAALAPAGHARAAGHPGHFPTGLSPHAGLAGPLPSGPGPGRLHQPAEDRLREVEGRLAPGRGRTGAPAGPMVHPPGPAGGVSGRRRVPVPPSRGGSSEHLRPAPRRVLRPPEGL